MPRLHRPRACDRVAPGERSSHGLHAVRGFVRSRPGLVRGRVSAPAGQRFRWRPMRRAARYAAALLTQAALSSAGGGGPHWDMSRTRRVAPVCSQRPLSTSTLHRRSISLSASHAAASCSRSRLKMRLSTAWRMRSCSPLTSLLAPTSARVWITRRYACARSGVISDLSHSAISHGGMMTRGNASAFSPMPKDPRVGFGRKARSPGRGCKLTRGRPPVQADPRGNLPEAQRADNLRIRIGRL